MDYHEGEIREDGITIQTKRFTPTDPRLGRHVRHDSRSLQYQVVAKDPSTLTSVQHQRYIPVLDQGKLGSCTGNAGTGCMGSAQYWPEGGSVLNVTDAVADESYAVDLYSAATQIDDANGSYPPDDTGSDGLSIAKVLQSRGLISGYNHAMGLEAALTALESGPVIVGIEWRNDMFEPDPDGRIHITGAVAGGHEIVFDQLDVENKRVWFTNSWGTSWGVHGRAYLTWDDFGALLDAQGDVVAFVPASQPAPTPAPGPVNPQPEPTPDWFARLKSAVDNFVKELEQIESDL